MTSLCVNKQQKSISIFIIDHFHFYHRVFPFVSTMVSICIIDPFPKVSSCHFQKYHRNELYTKYELYTLLNFIPNEPHTKELTYVRDAENLRPQTK